MKIIMLGLNHRTAKLALRERLAFTSNNVQPVYDGVHQIFPDVERVVLSTCNRTELYVAGPVERFGQHEVPSANGTLGGSVSSAPGAQPLQGNRHGTSPPHSPPYQGGEWGGRIATKLIEYLADLCQVDVGELAEVLVNHEGENAVRHLFQVASGLDSMILGEPQILGQVKRAYEDAKQRNTVGPGLHQVFQHAIATSKQVRSRTGIGKGRVSVGSIAIDLARKIFERFNDKVVVCIGAGEMAKVMLRHFLELHPARLWLTNRSLDRALALAQTMQLVPSTEAQVDTENTGPPAAVMGEFGGVRPFEQLDDLLVEADIVLTSTGAPEPIITARRFKPLMRRRRHRPLFMIDIALPRDIEEAVGSMGNVYLNNLDHLQSVVARTYEQRRDQLQACDSMITDAVRVCISEIEHRDISQMIKALRKKLHAIGGSEHERFVRKISHATPDELPKLVEEHSHRLINKVLHLPMKALGGRNTNAPLGDYASVLSRLFELDDVSQPNDANEDQVVSVETDKSIKAAVDRPAAKS